VAGRQHAQQTIEGGRRKVAAKGDQVALADSADVGVEPPPPGDGVGHERRLGVAAGEPKAEQIDVGRQVGEGVDQVACAGCPPQTPKEAGRRQGKELGSGQRPELENTDAAEIRPLLSEMELNATVPVIGSLDDEEKPPRILAIAPWLAVAMVLALAALSAWRAWTG
jgi:hypothetical protein